MHENGKPNGGDGEEMVSAGRPNWLCFVWLSQKKNR